MACRREPEVDYAVDQLPRRLFIRPLPQAVAKCIADPGREPSGFQRRAVIVPADHEQRLPVLHRLPPLGLPKMGGRQFVGRAFVRQPQHASRRTHPVQDRAQPFVWRIIGQFPTFCIPPVVSGITRKADHHQGAKGSCGPVQRVQRPAREGATLLDRGFRLNPAAIALAASVGKSRLRVFIGHEWRF